MPSIEKLPSGRYRAVYRAPSGAKMRVKGTFAGKRAAMDEAIQAEAAAKKSDWRDPRASDRTWGEWVQEWWPNRDIESSTLQRQLTQRVKHLDPQWWDTPLSAFTRHDIRSWAVSLMKESDLSRATAQKLTLMLSSSFSAAIDAGVLDSNPAARLKLGTVKVDSHRYLSHEEADTLMAVVTREVDRAVVSTLLGAGLRWGEVNGLQVERVDLRRQMIRVAEVWDSAGGRLKPYPKGERQRDVPIPEWLTERIEPLVVGRRSGFVFEHNGFKLHYANWRKKVWLRSIELADLAPLRIHDLRHTYASWLIQDGFSLAEVGQLLGHADPSTTQIYAHLLDPNGARVRAAIRKVG